MKKEKEEEEENKEEKKVIDKSISPLNYLGILNAFLFFEPL